MNSPGMKARAAGSAPRGPAQPLNIAIPNSMSYRNAAPPQLSPTDDDLCTPKKPQYYRPPGSPESPEVPQAFFNYNHDRIQNDLLDEICDEIGIKDATDLDFMDFEPPGVDDEFNPGVVGDEIDNLDQLIMFGQIDPQQGQGSESQQYGGVGKWGGSVDQSVPESSGAMPNNSPVYGNSPAKPIKSEGRHDLQGQCQASEGYGIGQGQGQTFDSAYSTGDVPQSPARRNSATNNWQQTSSVPSSQGNQSPYNYDDVPTSQAHMTDDYKIASPRKNSTDGSSSGGTVSQGPPSSHHDSMLKIAIAQDRMLGARTGPTSVGSPASLEPPSPASQVPASPGYQVPSPTTPSKSAPQQCKPTKVNQTDSSKGLDQFAAPENLPPGKERAMSRMKLTDNANSGKRSPFDQGYYSVGSGGSHYEDTDLSSATPPHCPDQPPSATGGEDKMLEFLSDLKDRSLTDDALLSLAQSKVKQENATSYSDSQSLVSAAQRQQQAAQALASQARMSTMRPSDGLSQPPRSPIVARREIHRAVLPSSTIASKPGMFQKQTSNSQGITFEPPPGGYKAPDFPQPGPNPAGYPQPGVVPPPPGPGQNAYNVPVAHPAMAASANCAPYPRSCRPEDMAYGAKRSGSNPSSPKKQRRLTYNPYQGDNSVGFNNPGQYNNPNMAGRPASGGQYGPQSGIVSGQMAGNGSLPQPLPSSGQPGGQMMSMQQRGSYGPHSQHGMQQQQHQMGAHGASMGGASMGGMPMSSQGVRMPMSSQGGYPPGQQHPQPGQYGNQGHMRQGQGQYSNQGYMGQGHMGQGQGHMGQGQGHMGQGQGHMGQSQGHMMQNSGYQQQQHPQQQRQQQHQGQMMYGQQQQQQQQSMNPGSQSSDPFDLDSSLEENTAYQQQSLGALIAGHPEAAKYGFMQQLVSDRSNAFRSHPLFPLLRDLIVADMNFSTPTFPFQLIANLPQDFDKLLSNYFQRNPPTTKYETNTAVENVVVDALRYAHKSLIEKISERKQKAGITEQPKMFSAIEDFCERFDQAVKHTMTRESTPKTNMAAPVQQPQPQQQPAQYIQQPKMELPSSQQPLPSHQMAAPGGMGAPPPQMGMGAPHQPTIIQPLSTPGPGEMNMSGPRLNHPPGQYMNPGYHGGNARPPSSNGPHGTMPPTGGGMMDGQAQQLRSISPFEQQTSASTLLSRQASYPQTSAQWPPVSSGGGYGPPGHASSLPSTPTKSAYRRGMYPQHRQNSGSSSSIHLSDVDLTTGHLAEQQKLGFGTGSMPNFINSSGITNRLQASTPPLGQSPYKGGGVRASSPVDIHRAGSEPALNCMKTYGSPQRENVYAKDNRNNNNNNNSSSGTNNNGSRKQVLPKEAVAIMLDWLREHRDNPYPNDDEKYMLIQQTKLTMAQINYWFTNARRRILPKWTLQRLMEEQARATGRELTPEQQKEILSTKLTPQAVRNILEGQSVKKSMSDISYGHIMNSVINQSS